MKPSIKRKWIRALRSGKYRQGHGVLRDRDGNYCCLGVLCELAIKDGVKLEVTLGKEGDARYDGCPSYPPLAVVNWAGLTDENPRIFAMVGAGGGVATLAGINDGGGSFKTIADLIEKHL